MMIFRDLFNFFFPLTCVSCNLSLYVAPLPLCYTCLQDYEPADIVELADRIKDFEIDYIELFCLWNYHTKEAAQLHKMLKYQGLISYGKPLGRLMAVDILESKDRDLDFDIIVPMPLSKARFLERGYNQAAELAKGMAILLNRPVIEDLLTKAKETRKQTGLNVDDRTSNTRGAFNVSGKYLDESPSILLVDDVITTGASMAAASAALKEVGYDQISLSALCFADQW